MPAPIDRPPVAPSLSTAVPAPPPAASASRPIAGEPKARRALPSLAGAEPLAGTDGLFFAHLLGAPEGAPPQGEGFGGGGLAFAEPPLGSGAVAAQLAEELAPQLPTSGQGPLTFAVMMPNLGAIEVRAEQAAQGWALQLGFARRDALRRVRAQAGACREALAAALGAPVELSLYGSAAL